VGVKPLGSVQRALRVIEAIAANQPIGLAELCRILDDDKSALQRALVTLADSGWIRPTGDQVTRWEITEQPLVIAGQARRRSGLVTRLHPFIESIRDTTGESVSVAVPDAGRIVTVDVVESPHLVRAAPRLGSILPAEASAAGLALFAHLDLDAVAEFLGAPVHAALRREIDRTRERGWSLNAGAVDASATSLGAAVCDATGRPQAAIVVSAPSDRLTADRYDEVAASLLEATDAAGDAEGGHRPAMPHP
jgi:IclR family transcriptional regulator, acetate operon repressor